MKSSWENSFGKQLGKQLWKATGNTARSSWENSYGKQLGKQLGKGILQSSEAHSTVQYSTS